MSFPKPEARIYDTSLTVAAPPVCAKSPCPRGEHARMLAIAAARRLRAIDRRRGERPEDAEYWIACAPVALAKASSLRDAFSPLP